MTRSYIHPPNPWGSERNLPTSWREARWGQVAYQGRDSTAFVEALEAERPLNLFVVLMQKFGPRANAVGLMQQVALMRAEDAAVRAQIGERTVPHPLVPGPPPAPPYQQAFPQRSELGIVSMPPSPQVPVPSEVAYDDYYLADWLAGGHNDAAERILSIFDAYHPFGGP